MGQLTFNQIVANGLAKAGASSNLTVPAQGWLNSWLSRAYDAWPWPFLTKKVSAYVLPAGTQSFNIGYGAGGVTEGIRRVLDPIYVYNASRTARYTARIRQAIGGPIDLDEDVIDPTTFVGIPTQFKVVGEPLSFGEWIFYPTPIPDQQYLLKFNYIMSPDRISSFSVTPVYPCDETMELVVEAHALRYAKLTDASEAKFEEVRNRVMNDRVAYGQVDGTNDLLGLNTSVFR